MQEDENQQDGADEKTDEGTEETGGTQEGTGTEEGQEHQEQEVDYRGKLNAQNNFLKKEGYEFKDGKWVRPATATSTETQAPDAKSVSLADLHAIRDVHEEDVERLQKFAKDEGITIREARKSDEWKAIEALRAEKRTTAHAANTSNVRRSPSGQTDDALLKAAEAGRLPDDEDGINRLIAAKMKQK